MAPHTSYTTVDEYRVIAANPAAAQKMKAMQEAASPASNPSDILVCLDVDDATVLLPHNIYDAEDVSILKTRSLMLDTRNFDHYMGRFSVLAFSGDHVQMSLSFPCPRPHLVVHSNPANRGQSRDGGNEPFDSAL